MDFQKLIDTMNKAGEDTRANYHLCLGEFADLLESLPADTVVKFSNGTYPSEPESYRGYYSDLSFPPSDEEMRAGALAKLAREAIGKTFEGYKGGDFIMHAKTPLWAAHYGECGPAIVSTVRDAGTLFLVTKETD